MSQVSGEGGCAVFPLLGILVFGLGGVGLFPVTITFDFRAVIVGFMAGVLVALAGYLILPRRLREG